MVRIVLYVSDLAARWQVSNTALSTTKEMGTTGWETLTWCIQV